MRLAPLRAPPVGVDTVKMAPLRRRRSGRAGGGAPRAPRRRLRRPPSGRGRHVWGPSRRRQLLRPGRRNARRCIL